MSKTYIINGVELELYTIGELAKLLDRQRQTVRKWEKDGIIPQATFRSKTNRRLYTEQQMRIIIQAVEKFDVKQGFAIHPDFKQFVYEGFDQVNPEKLFNTQ